MTCADCKYFQRYSPKEKGVFNKRIVESDSGRCWRFPPMLAVYGKLFAHFARSTHPEVYDVDYCGEFTRK